RGGKLPRIPICPPCWGVRFLCHLERLNCLPRTAYRSGAFLFIYFLGGICDEPLLAGIRNVGINLGGGDIFVPKHFLGGCAGEEECDQ
ncbi:hypothetical protein COY35_01885, partial [candidate division WWE3 bacterium CG_4_10_14_0_2_um_filter_47_8]